MLDFEAVLRSALTPIALISGVGLLLLSLVNRYNHALDRTRQLLKERPTREGAERDVLERAIQVIYGRCRVMKNAILCIVSSIASSGLIVFLTVLEGLTGTHLQLAKGLLLLLTVVLIVSSAVLFLVDIRYSLHAIREEVNR